jgi:hypothetical protein
MIKQVSWADYWTVVAVLCAAYYIVIIVLFFRKELFEKINGKKKLQPIAATPPTSSPHPAEYKGPRSSESDTTPEEKLFALANQLMQEINPVFRNDYVKGELMTALKVILRKYGLLKGTAFQVSVNNFIQMESENQCSVSLSEGELRNLWNG